MRRRHGRPIDNGGPGSTRSIMGSRPGALGIPRLWLGSLGRGKLPIRCPMIRIAVLD